MFWNHRIFGRAVKQFGAAALMATIGTMPALARDVPAPGAVADTGRIAADELDPVTRCAIGRFRHCNIGLAVARGLFETGLRPVFPDPVTCRGIDEGYAVSYSGRRNREMYHGGIDIPAPWGTPMIAAADGTVVGKFAGDDSFRGIEIVLRHAPQDTGLPLWIYTQYGHFQKMPTLAVGQRVRMGDVLGPTGNSGIGRTGTQSSKRRPAIHFGVFYSASGRYAEARNTIIPADGWWMDPLGLYRRIEPFDSVALKALPAGEKQISIPVLLDDGTTVPPATKLVWPYACTRR